MDKNILEALIKLILFIRHIGSRLYITIEMVMRWWPSVGPGWFSWIPSIQWCHRLGINCIKILEIEWVPVGWFWLNSCPVYPSPGKISITDLRLDLGNPDPDSRGSVSIRQQAGDTKHSLVNLCNNRNIYQQYLQHLQYLPAISTFRVDPYYGPHSQKTETGSEENCEDQKLLSSPHSPRLDDQRYRC